MSNDYTTVLQKYQNLAPSISNLRGRISIIFGRTVFKNICMFQFPWIVHFFRFFWFSYISGWNNSRAHHSLIFFWGGGTVHKNYFISASVIDFKANNNTITTSAQSTSGLFSFVFLTSFSCASSSRWDVVSSISALLKRTTHVKTSSVRASSAGSPLNHCHYRYYGGGCGSCTGRWWTAMYR